MKSIQNRNRGKIFLRLLLIGFGCFVFLFCIPGFSVSSGRQDDPGSGQKKRSAIQPDSGRERDIGLTGADIMAEVFRRHKMFPYVYEEQTIILTDNENHRDIRRVRHFSRMETDGTIKYLMVFDHPSEVRGFALRCVLDHMGHAESRIYLPALGKEISLGHTRDHARYLLGTDFTIEDIVESLTDFQYTRIPDKNIARIDYFVVEAFPNDKQKKNRTGYGKRRFFIRQDNFFVVRTDYFDRNNRFIKQLTRHDLNKVDKMMWRANMLLMKDKRQTHNTLIKINRRVFSPDYVRPEIFTESWLRKNYSIPEEQGADILRESSEENQTADKRN